MKYLKYFESSNTEFIDNIKELEYILTDENLNVDYIKYNPHLPRMSHLLHNHNLERDDIVINIFKGDSDFQWHTAYRRLASNPEIEQITNKDFFQEYIDRIYELYPKKFPNKIFVIVNWVLVFIFRDLGRYGVGRRRFYR